MRVFLCDVGNIPRDVVKKAAALLPECRAPKADIREDAFATRVTGTLLTHYAVKQISPETVCEIWKKTSEGKPFIQDCPVQFSIAHASGLVGVAVSTEHPVGLDIEKVRPMRQGFATRYFSESEQAEILSAIDPDEALIRLWTAKEAVGKHHGSGLAGNPAVINVQNATITVLEKEGARFALSLAPQGDLPTLEWVDFSELVP